MTRTSGSPELREATAEDAGAILALWRDAGAAPTATDDVASVRLVIDSPVARMVVAVAAGEIIGSIIVTFDGWRGSMYRLAVAPGYRRSGAARALPADAEAHLRSVGCRRSTANVLGDEAAARGFWGAAGYSPQPGVMRYTKSL